MDQDKWEVGYDGEVGPFFNEISDEKYFDDGRKKPVSMGEEGTTEVEYQVGKFISISNGKIN